MIILLVEDDVTIARLLKEGLEDESYAVDVVMMAAKVIELLRPMIMMLLFWT